MPHKLVITASPLTRRPGMTESYFFSGIGGAIFSAGAGGSAGLAPSFWASALGRAGSGAGVVGRAPPGVDSAGTLVGEPVGDGVACRGWPGVPVACAVFM